MRVFSVCFHGVQRETLRACTDEVPGSMGSLSRPGSRARTSTSLRKPFHSNLFCLFDEVYVHLAGYGFWFSDSVGSVELKNLVDLEMEDIDLDLITPKILGQLFDRILECLQTDFRELIDKLKAQVTSASAPLPQTHFLMGLPTRLLPLLVYVCVRVCMPRHVCVCTSMQAYGLVKWATARELCLLLCGLWSVERERPQTEEGARGYLLCIPTWISFSFFHYFCVYACVCVCTTGLCVACGLRVL